MRRTALIILLFLLATTASPVLAESNPSDVAADFNHDGFADLAAGAWGERVLGAIDAGAVSVLYGSASGLTATGGQLFTQDTPGVPGSPELLDTFGWSLTTGGTGTGTSTASASGSGSTQRTTS